MTTAGPPAAAPAAPPAAPPALLPVVLIAGYLGAGKTTLVNQLLRRAQGRRIAVLVNDFGSINIDADLIESAPGGGGGGGGGATAGVLSLSGGCLCCSFGDDLVGTLAGLARRQPPPDVCLVELSGVALPAAVARTARLVQAVQLVGTLVVCDAEHIQRQAADRYVGDTVRGQVQQADWLMLNKPDLVSTEALQATATWLQRVAPQARQWAGSAQQAVPGWLLDGPNLQAPPGDPMSALPGDRCGDLPGALVGAGDRDGDRGNCVGGEDGMVDADSPGGANPAASFAARPLSARWADERHAAAVFESRSVVLPADADLQAVGAQLAAADSGVLRAKGLLGGRLLQVAGGRWAVSPAPAVAGPAAGALPAVSAPGGGAGRLVMIGLRGRWNPGQLAQAWGCTGP